MVFQNYLNSSFLPQRMEGHRKGRCITACSTHKTPTHPVSRNQESTSQCTSAATLGLLDKAFEWKHGTHPLNSELVNPCPVHLAGLRRGHHSHWFQILLHLCCCCCCCC